MEYCVLGKDNITGKSAEQVITLMLHEYSRQLYGFTRAEFDSIVEYDVLIIMASYYTTIKLCIRARRCDNYRTKLR